MPTFEFPDSFKEHKQYVALLKKALLVVKPGAEKKFLYYAQYPFGKAKFPLVLVDYGLNCPTMLSKAGYKPTAEGLVTLTAGEELNFEASKGTLKRIKLRKYVGKMGQGFKPIFVPPGEVDDEAEGSSSESEEGASVEEIIPPPPTKPLPQVSNPLAPPLPLEPKVAEVKPTEPPLDDAMKRKLEFEEKKFALTQRVRQIRAQASPAELEALKKQSLQMADGLIATGKFEDATKVLDLLVAKLVAPVAPKPGATPTKPPPPAPKLSTYMNASRDWKAAKKAAGDGVFNLKTTILKECDPELKKAVEAKINSLNSIMDVMDDKIITKIEDAGREADAERQAERNQELAKVATNMLAALRKHPLAEVADNNPFGAFTIRGPVETVLNKFVTDFGG